MKLRYLLLAGCCAAPLLAFAEIEEIIVTASRSAETADETLAAVTVIDREQIETRQANSLPELLTGVPGLSVSNAGGLGKLSSVFLRGTESNHVLVLIDGIKVGNASSGTTAFEQLPLDQVERIEIVRGPRSSLYGSEAIGGVIQVFTRQGGGATRPSFSLSGGSDGYFKLAAALSGGGEDSWFSGSVSREGNNGFNSCSGDPVSFAGCATFEPDVDGFDSLSGSLRAGHRFNNGAEIDLHWLGSAGETEYDGGFQNRSEFRQAVVGGRLQFNPSTAWQVSLSGGRSADNSDNFKDRTFAGDFRTTRHQYSWLNQIALDPDHQVTLGLDYQDDRLASSTAYSATSRDNLGLFGQYQGQFDAHSLQVSLRRDDNEQFGAHTTGSLAWGMDVRHDLRVTASYGTAFVAPTFNDLYAPPGWGANPNLQPESSESVELGLSGVLVDGHWQAALYHTVIDNLISADGSWTMQNISQARIRGVEASLTQQIADWQLAASLTLQDPLDQSDGPNHGNQLSRRAKQMLSFDLDRDFGRYSLGAGLYAEGKRYDNAANTRALAGYARVDLRGSYDLGHDLTLQARIENLFDTDYETASFYNQPGRSVFVTLRYQPAP